MTIVASQRVVLGEGDSLEITPAAVRLDGSRIGEVRRLGAPGYREDLKRWCTETGLAVRDFGDQLISPAFVNAHTHLALGFLRGAAPPAALRGNMVRELYFGVEQNLEPEDVEVFTRMGAYESLLAGVGLVWDHYYHGEAVAQGLRATGLAGVVAPTLQDLSGPGVRWRADQLRATETIARSTELAERGVFGAVGPHATDTVSEPCGAGAPIWRARSACRFMPTSRSRSRSTASRSTSVTRRHCAGSPRSASSRGCPPPSSPTRSTPRAPSSPSSKRGGTAWSSAPARSSCSVSRPILWRGRKPARAGQSRPTARRRTTR
jgi:hypothetical protein